MEEHTVAQLVCGRLGRHPFFPGVVTSDQQDNSTKFKLADAQGRFLGRKLCHRVNLEKTPGGRRRRRGEGNAVSEEASEGEDVTTFLNASGVARNLYRVAWFDGTGRYSWIGASAIAPFQPPPAITGQAALGKLREWLAQMRGGGMATKENEGEDKYFASTGSSGATTGSKTSGGVCGRGGRNASLRGGERGREYLPRGEERRGEDRRGEDRRGEERRGEERRGEERRGGERRGEERRGEERRGEERRGEERRGEERRGEERRGEERRGEERRGEERRGEERRGEDRSGEGWRGEERIGEERIGAERGGEERRG
ncbi:hypothetical protein LSTR_LSTR009285 [Laodelphax striatellus]|uniref:Uncharacterized protein n=1 Tax=Laodelphax striatellus TaxID=195883 RepID=A0A482XL12_LAOST|nr:hypothetical protein LSTR_LSTR009285 [Laodelphax striatellus]